ncbi:hypothetical protein EDD36DRAFT_465746 [Exophiala viscosa]|uniref:Hexosyltransferase n=2 Tax=Exophiala viscosa TaxID=2486360 RepID=A0AAN6DS88_9EURO|nr:hypothetical protein EDD36DRAFT_465746 [Exophiala viscosa]
MLPALEETRHIANTIKPIEFMKYLVNNGSTTWKFASKADDDSFVNLGKVAIARVYTHPDPVYNYPQGGFYSFSWELVCTLVELYEENPIQDEHEDVLNGRLLYEAHEDFEFTILHHPLAFDYDEKNEDVSAWAHRVISDAIYVHNLKEDETYLKVASMFDANGTKAEIPA